MNQLRACPQLTKASHRLIPTSGARWSRAVDNSATLRGRGSKQCAECCVPCVAYVSLCLWFVFHLSHISCKTIEMGKTIQDIWKKRYETIMIMGYHGFWWFLRSKQLRESHRGYATDCGETCWRPASQHRPAGFCKARWPGEILGCRYRARSRALITAPAFPFTWMQIPWNYWSHMILDYINVFENVAFTAMFLQCNPFLAPKNKSTLEARFIVRRKDQHEMENE